MKKLGAVVDQLLLPHLPETGEPVLVIGCLAAELVQLFAEKQPLVNCEIRTVDDIFNQQAASTKFSLALVVHRFGDHAGVEDELVIGKNLLSRVRDVFAERVLHLVITESVTHTTAGQSSWLLTDSLAMGFVKLDKLQVETAHVAVYDFNIRHYKSEPDWLNAKHWAHPERWGRR